MRNHSICALAIEITQRFFLLLISRIWGTIKMKSEKILQQMYYDAMHVSCDNTKFVAKSIFSVRRTHFQNHLFISNAKKSELVTKPGHSSNDKNSRIESCGLHRYMNACDRVNGANYYCIHERLADTSGHFLVLRRNSILLGSHATHIHTNAHKKHASKSMPADIEVKVNGCWRAM